MSAWTGTTPLTQFALRRERLKTLIWVLAISGLTAATVSTLISVYGSESDNQARAAVARTPVGVIFGGPGYGLDDYTLGPTVISELLTTLLIAVAIMSVLQVTRHTRADEESGRLELLRANPIGPQAHPTAALLTCAVANLLIGIGVGVALASYELAAADSFAVGLGVALTGISAGAVALVCAQVCEHARSANGLAALILALLFLARVIGDMAEVGGTPLSWTSPFAWVHQTRAFVDLRWLPLVWYLVFIAAFLALAYVLAARRDVGSGLISARAGRAKASSLLSGTFALDLRLQRGSIIAWAIGVFAVGATFGSLADQINDLVADNPEAAAIIGTDGSQLTEAYFATSTIYALIGASAFAIISVGRMRTEEQAGRAELIASTALSRYRWMLTALAVSVLAVVILIAAGGLGLGVTAAATLDDWSLLTELFVASFAQLPIALLIVALASLIFGWIPRLMALVWAWFSYGAVATMLGPLLNLPQWAIDLSPFEILSRPPAESLDAVAFAAVLVTAVAAAAAGLVGFRRRDIG